MDAKGARALVERLAREGRYADGASTDVELNGSVEASVASVEASVAEAAGETEPLAPAVAAEHAA